MKISRNVCLTISLISMILFVFSGIALAGKVGIKEKAGSVQIEIKSTGSETVKSTTPEEVTPVLLNVSGEPDEASISSPNSGEEINWQVISSGGQIGGVSANYGLSGTVGQVAVGGGSGPSYSVSHGFWQAFSSFGGNCITAGDANHDGGANVGDAVFLISFVFKGGQAPTFPNEGDANADCGVNVGDAVYLISYVFKGGFAPVCGCAE